MRFVFVTDELPRPGFSGHLALNHAIVEWLCAGGHEVWVLLTKARFRWPVQRFGIAPVAGPDIASWRNFVFATTPRGVAGILTRQFSKLLPGSAAAALRRKTRALRYDAADAVIGAYITDAQSAWCASRILELEPDAILVDTIFRAPVLRAPGLQRFNSVVLAPDVFYRRHKGMLAAGYRVYPPQLTREQEAAFLSLGKAIAAIQPEEAAEIRIICPAQTVCVTTLPALLCPAPLGL